MENNYKYREFIDTRNNKKYIQIYKNNKIKKKEREIVYAWALANIEQTEFNFYVKATDVHTQFVNTARLNISQKSLGSYLKYILNKLNIEVKKVNKVQKGYKPGTFYYGIAVKGVANHVQHFNISEKIGYNTLNLISFGYFNEEKIKTWLTKCFIIDKKLTDSFLSTQDLFINYSNFYLLKIELTRGNLVRFGLLLNKILKTEYAFVAKKQLYNPVEKKQFIFYSCIEKK